MIQRTAIPQLPKKGRYGAPADPVHPKLLTVHVYIRCRFVSGCVPIAGMDRPKRRRRRKGRGPASAPSQAPLQPAYPDMEREEPEEVNGNVDMVSELANETEVEEQGPPAAANDANRGQQQQRNRRRRGRRGRPVPKPVTPVEAIPVAPAEELPAETQVEDDARGRRRA